MPEMWFDMKIIFAGFLFLAMIYKIEVVDGHLQCWHCSSDTIGAEDFCDTDFSESSIPTDLLKERNISILRSCNSTINSDHERPVCRKTVEEINGKVITKRFCYYTNKSQHLNHCQQEATEKNVDRIFCQDCLVDKCNGAGDLAGMFGFGMILLPIGLAKSAVF